MDELNDDYIRKSLNELNGFMDNTTKIKNEFKAFKEQINNFINICEKQFLEIVKEIKSSISLFNEISQKNNYEKNKNDDFFNKINEAFSKCKDNNNYLQSVNILNQNLINSINNFLYPQNDNLHSSSMGTNPSDNSSIYQQWSNRIINNSYYEDFFIYVDNEVENIDFNEKEFKDPLKTQIIKVCKDDNEEKEDKKNEINENEIKCSDCKINKAVNICSHCNNYYCEGCTNFINKFKVLQNHILTKIPDTLLKNKEIEEKKDKFLDDFIKFIKYYIMKCNYLLKSKNIFELPLIEDVNKLESHQKYLNEINNLCNNNMNDDEKDIEGKLIRALETIFNSQKLNISYYDMDGDLCSDEVYELTESDFDKIKNKLFYFITVASKEDLEIDSNMADIIVKKIYESLCIEKNNIFILINDKVNNFVKSKKFYELHYNHFELKNPIISKLYELKFLSDNYLCYQCKIPKEYFDYRGNTLNPNSNNNLIRGTEKYDPPYGWIGIGLNVLEKYDNGSNDWLTNNSNSSKWAIAYHGISSKNSSDMIMKLLKYIIIKKDLKKAISKIKSNSNDKRNWGKVGKGIYLTPNIRIAEQYTGIISFKEKKYKVLLMARVYIKGIREPENSHFWVLDDKDIRIYRILFKEIS